MVKHQMKLQEVYFSKRVLFGVYNHLVSLKLTFLKHRRNLLVLVSSISLVGEVGRRGTVS